MSRERSFADGQRVDRRARPRGPRSRLIDLLYSILRFIARHVRGFWSALVAFLTVGLAVGIAAAALFAAIAGIVEGGVTQRFDESVLQWFAQHRTPFLDDYMLEITALGSGMVLIVLVATASLFLWLTKHRWSVYILLVGVLGGQIVSRTLKGVFDRDRPIIVELLQHVSSPSFPSGHAMTSLIVYGSVAYVIGRLETTRRMRRFTWGIAALLILAIGISRMYLGVHYPSDVVGGFLAGLAWLTFVAASTKAVQFFAPRRAQTRREEPDIANPA